MNLSRINPAARPNDRSRFHRAAAGLARWESAMPRGHYRKNHSLRRLCPCVDPEDRDLATSRNWWVFGCNPGYWRTKKAGQPGLTLHRMIVERVIGRMLGPGEIVDHIDGNSLNNRRSNLRVTDCAGNLQNRGAAADNKLGYRGICEITDKRGPWEYYRVYLNVLGNRVGQKVFPRTPAGLAAAIVHRDALYDKHGIIKRPDHNPTAAVGVAGPSGGNP